MGTVTIENSSPIVFIENGWVKSTTLGPIIVDSTPFTVVKYTSPIQIPES